MRREKESLVYRIDNMCQEIDTFTNIYPRECSLISTKLKELKTQITLFLLPFPDYPYSKSFFILEYISKLIEDFDSSASENTEEILLQIEVIQKILRLNEKFDKDMGSLEIGAVRENMKELLEMFVRKECLN